MHRTLWLIRHAKARDPVFGQSDDQRPLAPRGLADLANLVSHLAEESTAPAQWLWLSPALRTRQTAEPLGKLWHSESVEDRALYLADPFELLNCLQTTPTDCHRAALVGHNPSISQLAHYLLNASDQAKMDANLPTLGALRMTFQGNWPDLGVGGCALERYFTPSSHTADR